MKTIYFIRHAKSSWNTPVMDHDRLLSERGRSDAQLIANELKKRNLGIQKVYSSTAKRAVITTNIITLTLEVPQTAITFTKQLYDFNGSGVMQVIKPLPDTLESVILFGHNPAFTNVVNILGDQFFSNIPTCGVVAITFNTDKWSQLGNQVEKGEVIFHLFPKTLK